jgi:nucleoredoxin
MLNRWETLLGDRLLTRKGQSKSTEELLSSKTAVGLFFTASWCTPCREFTPILSMVYRNMFLNQYKDLSMKDRMEIVMISLDRQENAFRDYHRQTPFLAMPFYDRQRVQELRSKYQVKTIPALVYLDSNGQVIEREGRRMVEKYYQDPRTLWQLLCLPRATLLATSHTVKQKDICAP